MRDGCDRASWVPSTLRETEVSRTWFLEEERNLVTMGAWSSSLAPLTVTDRIPDNGLARSFRSPSMPVPSRSYRSDNDSEIQPTKRTSIVLFFERIIQYMKVLVPFKS